MFYEKFSAACKRAKISPTAAAASVGIAASVVTGWKQGSEPTLENACKAAKALSMSIDELLKEDEKSSMSEIQIFNYNRVEVRTIQNDGEPWFVLRDVCNVLGLGTPARVAERLDPDEVSQTHITDSMGRQQETTIINESGLYNVILRSDKPEAKPFRKWVTSEVLPTIRRI